MHDWSCLHILGGHKATVSDVAVHPSGKLALSVSRDNTLRLWNLIEGDVFFLFFEMLKWRMSHVDCVVITGWNQVDVPSRAD